MEYVPNPGATIFIGAIPRDIAVWHLKTGMQIDYEWNSGFLCKSLVDQHRKVWKSMMMIPWAALGATPCSPMPWHCNFFRASGKFHGDELLVWSPTGYGESCFHKLDSFGQLKLIH
jgi:hypothetical protein